METVHNFPHAILFVLDPSSKNTKVPDYVAGDLIAANESCVSVGTQAEVDGEVRVVLADSLLPQKDLSVVFHGRIETPSRKVAVVTSAFDIALEIGIDSRETNLVIWTNDPRNPNVVAVEAKPNA